MTRSDPVALDLPFGRVGQHGRVFLPFEGLRTVDFEELRATLEQTFVEDDDLERLRLLEQALHQGVVDVEAYPAEAPPHEPHLYIVAPSVSPEPLFACVLAPQELVRQLVESPPHLILETATLQVIDEAPTPSTVAAALARWVHRVWPGLRAPTFRVRFWPSLALRLVPTPGLAATTLAASMVARSRGLPQGGIELLAASESGSSAGWTGT